ncbi:MAG: zinc dependent phospholipase C family protein [Eggerthellaceae bacterium]|nr:zinc dependent phospholipase C family protein [Eggerthellaceae bacterium]
MPAIITHHVFGCEVHDKLGGIIGDSATARDAFLLGNIGPDPLFCVRYAPGKPWYAELGWIMHRQDPASLLAALHASFSFEGADEADEDTDVPKAYALGFVCHYLLDRTVHPIVYAQQHAICKALPEKVSADAGRVVHALVETELDEFVLGSHLNKTVLDWLPHNHVLKCPAPALSHVSRHMARIVLAAYGKPVPASLFEWAVKLHRSAQSLLDARITGLGTRLDYARLFRGSRSHIEAMTHRIRQQADTVFSNDDRVPWPPFPGYGNTVHQSFGELYDKAFAQALEVLPEFALPSFSQTDCEKLAGSVNFYGQQAQDIS